MLASTYAVDENFLFALALWRAGAELGERSLQLIDDAASRLNDWTSGPPPIFAKIEAHKLLASAIQLMRERGATPCAELAALEAIYVRSSSALAELSNEVTALFQTLEIPCLAIKGADLVTRANPRKSLRVMWDLDLLIPPARITEAVTHLEKFGFRHGQVRPNSLILQAADTDITGWINDNSHYEIPALFKLKDLGEYPADASLANLLRKDRVKVIGGRLHLMLAVDVHFNISPDFDLAEVWKDAGQSYAGQPAFLSPTMSVFFTVARAYHQICRRTDATFAIFSDAVAVLTNFSEPVDFERLANLAVSSGNEPAFYYFAALAEPLAATDALAAALRQLKDACCFRHSPQDWGNPARIMTGLPEAVLPLSARF